MFCENCGAKMADNAKFCTECGTKVATVAAKSVGLETEKMVPIVEQNVEKGTPVVEKVATKAEDVKTVAADGQTEAITGAVAVGGATVGAAVTAGEAVAEKVAEVAAAKATEVNQGALSARDEILRMAAQKEKGKKPVDAVPAPVPNPSSKSQENRQIQQNNGIFEEYFEEIKKFNCNGRLNRLKYWKFVGVNFIFVFVVATILSMVGANATILKGFSSIMSILFIPFSVRRLHDLNRSGWFLLLGIIPVVNFFFGIYAGFFKGTEGPNNYGEDPLAGK